MLPYRIGQTALLSQKWETSKLLEGGITEGQLRLCCWFPVRHRAESNHQQLPSNCCRKPHYSTQLGSSLRYFRDLRKLSVFLIRVSSPSLSVISQQKGRSGRSKLFTVSFAFGAKENFSISLLAPFPIQAKLMLMLKEGTTFERYSYYAEKTYSKQQELNQSIPCMQNRLSYAYKASSFFSGRGE